MVVMEMEHPLTTARKAARLTQQELAGLVGCERWMINRIEAGTRQPSMRLLQALVEHTGVSADDLLRWKAGAAA